ncbi:MAG TPA: hypothetical protein VFT64_05780 [Rickettsiales bacterium]|nr:hypothetical protein [Rickettsiales bacterium]
MANSSPKAIPLLTFGMMLMALAAILGLKLLSSLLSGLLVYLIIESGARLLERGGVIPATAKKVLLAVIGILVLGLFLAGILSLLSSLSKGQESFEMLMQRMADTVGTTRNYLPATIQNYLPVDLRDWQATISDWLRHNADYVSMWGKSVGTFLVHIVLGMVIGGLIAIHPPARSEGVLGEPLKDRVSCLAGAFRNVVFSQAKISAINTLLTGIFLVVILPLIGHSLPFTKTILIITFIVGLLPVAGNLISNSIILLIALSVSPADALAALIFLICIHKLEYFFNAHIIGTQIKAHAWEILLAMLVMEAAFGLPGLLAAPIYYAYLKDELTSQHLI